MSRLSNRWYAALLGFSCLAGQLLCIREFLVVFQGNELSIGVVLAAWLLLQAAGSFVAGLFSSRIAQPQRVYAWLALASAFLLPLTVLACRIAPGLITITAGEGLSLARISIVGFAVLAPLALVLGSQFPLLAKCIQHSEQRSLSEATGITYYAEAAGFGMAGIVLTAGFFLCISPLYISLFPAWLNMAAALTLSQGRRRRKALVLIAAALLAIPLGSRLDKASIKTQWRGSMVSSQQASAYGTVTILRQAEQYAFYYDGAPFMTIPHPDQQFIEDLVFFPLASIDQPRNALAIGSGLGGIIDRLLAFPGLTISYAELDPLIIRLARAFSLPLTQRELSDPRVSIYLQDGRRFLKTSRQTFDAILMNLPLPASLQLNRLYSREFFALAKRRLSTRGVLALATSGADGYLSDEQVDLNNSLLTTLRDIFPCVQVIPGLTNLFLASNDPAFHLDPAAIISRLNALAITSPLFTDFYVRERLSPLRRQWLTQRLGQRRPSINTDLKPCAVWFSLGIWNQLFSPSVNRFLKQLTQQALWLGTGLALLVLCFLILPRLFPLLKPKLFHNIVLPAVVSVNGLCGMAFNLSILLTMQACHGLAFSLIGLLMGSFMLGMMAGSWIATQGLQQNTGKPQQMLRRELLVLAYSAFLPASIMVLHRLSGLDITPIISVGAFALLSCAGGFVVSFSFPLANALFLNSSGSSKRPKNVLYSADLIGACIAAVGVSVIAIPLWGFITTLLVLVGLKCATTLLVWQFSPGNRSRLSIFDI